MTLKYRLFSGPAGQKMLELKAAPNRDGRTEVRYTTDGSDPKLNGGAYDGPVEIAKGTQVVLAFAECDGVQSDVLNIPITWDGPDPEPSRSIPTSRSFGSGGTNAASPWSPTISWTGSSGTKPSVTGAKISVTGDRWAELTLHEKIKLDAAQLREAAEAVRKLPGSGQLAVEAAAIHFDRGQRLLGLAQRGQERIEARGGAAVMARRASKAAEDALAGAFGFDPQRIGNAFPGPHSRRRSGPGGDQRAPLLGCRPDRDFHPFRRRARRRPGPLPRSAAQVECHRRGRAGRVQRPPENPGQAPGRWKTGYNPVSRVLGQGAYRAGLGDRRRRSCPPCPPPSPTGKAWPPRSGGGCTR